MDLDAYDIDADLRDRDVTQLRDELLAAVSRPSALVTYRPSTFLSAVAFSRRDRCRYLGMFGGHQSAFEHKPWLESLVADTGTDHIPWRYVPNVELLDTARMLTRGPLMLRRSRTSGGVGLVKVATDEELVRLWPDEPEAYVSVAPFIDEAIPVNVSAVVWADGTTVHPASVQLIGVPECTTRPFGYCGNDFSAMAGIGSPALDKIDHATRVIGDLMRGLGYRGAFGVDFLVRGDRVIFTEVNPRFQGGTHAACQLSVLRGESCLLTEHVAALLDIPCPPDRPLTATHDGLPDLAHIVVHNRGPAAHLDGRETVLPFRSSPHLVRSDVVTRPDLLTDPGATIARITVGTQVTDDGFSLRDDWRGLLS